MRRLGVGLDYMVWNIPRRKLVYWLAFGMWFFRSRPGNMSLVITA